MDIIFYHPFFNTDEWLSGIQKRLPDAKVRVWKKGDTAPADYALVWKPPFEILNGRKGIKAVFVLGAGVDAIIEQERAHPGMLPADVPLIRLQDAGMALQMEEYTTAVVLRYFRHLDEYQKQQIDNKWQIIAPYTHENFIIGVMGVGVLGSAVAKRLASFGFKVKGWSRSKKDIKGVRSYSADQLDAFLQGTNLIINQLPNTPDTVGILNKSLFNKLEKGAYLINIARGIHLHEKDLLAALESGQLKAATLDVFSGEPLPNEHPFWHHPYITITPHISAMTYPEIGMDQICNKIKGLQAGKSVLGIVDLVKGY